MYSIAQHSIKRITANIKFLNLPSGVLSYRSLSAHFDDNIQFSLRCEASNTQKQAGASLSPHSAQNIFFPPFSRVSISDKNYRNINRENCEKAKGKERQKEYIKIERERSD